MKMNWLKKLTGLFLMLLFLAVTAYGIPTATLQENRTVTTQKSNKKKKSNYNDSYNNNTNNSYSDSHSGTGSTLGDLLALLFGTDDAELPSDQEEAITETESEQEEIEYHFRSKKYLSQHFEKHGDEFDYETEEEYEAAASKVANDPDALHKYEKEDGDDIYYLEDTNEFVVVSKDGYLRTYFKPSAGKKYFDRQ